MRDTQPDGRSSHPLSRRGLLRASGALLAGGALSGHATATEAEEDGPPRVAWNRTYGDGLRQRGLSVAQAPDGGFVVAGETGVASPDDFADVLVVRTDAAGDVEWTRTYGDAGYQSAVEVLPVPEGGYVLVLDARAVDSDDNHVAAIRLDEDGTRRWSRRYGPDNTDVRGAVRRSDGGFAAVGTDYSGSGPAEAFLLTVDARGRGERFVTYELGTADTRLFGHAPVEVDDGFALLTTVSPPRYEEYPALVRTDADGTERWRRRYSIRGYDRGADAVRGADGGFVVVGSARAVGCTEIIPGQPEPDLSSPDAFVLKVDDDGGRRWVRTFSAPGPEYASADAAAVVRTPDGGYAFAGDRYDPAGRNTPFWVVGTDADGRREWELTAGGRKSNYPFSLIRTADDGYAVAGFTTAGHPAEPDVRLVRLTADS